MNDDNKPLSDSALAELLAKMDEGPKAVPAVARTGYARPRVSVSFEDHPLYQQMKFQRSFAAFAKLRSPYYRLHEVKAGAASVIEGRAVAKAASEFGSSVSASRISAGERSVHRDLEGAIARNYEAEDSIAFVSGHAAAVSTIATLLGPKDLLLHDALIHNCVVVGAQLAGCTRRLFPHNDLDALEAALLADRHRFERVLIVSEGLFSMDGDGPDLARLIAIKTDFAAWLMIDDAHGLGVLGPRGRGIFEHQAVAPGGVDLWLGTLSKSLVSCGGYIAGCEAVVDLLKHQAPGFVYSVGMPAPAAVAATVALELMAREPERVARLQRQSQRFFERAREAGLDTGESWGLGVVPVIIGETVPTLVLAERLLGHGINAFPIVPPGVPEKLARLRFFINATHSDQQIDDAVDSGAREIRELGDVSLKTILRA